MLPRPTPEAQKELLEKLRSGSTESADEEVSDEFAIQAQ
jgi:hypothetical protein